MRAKRTLVQIAISKMVIWDLLVVDSCGRYYADIMRKNSV
jgi:hypothetical protein